MKRSFIIVGTKATASPSFSLIDLAGTSGRLDVLLRCLRSALLVSHGVRRDAVAYLVLLGGELAPRVLRVRGAEVRFLRPDERSLATLAQKALTRADTSVGRGVFADIRPGIAVASGGIETALADANGAALYVLEEDTAPDLRDEPLGHEHAAFVVGDHFGFDDATRDALARAGARPICLGPVSIHADDCVSVVSNELDRRTS